MTLTVAGEKKIYYLILCFVLDCNCLLCIFIFEHFIKVLFYCLIGNVMCICCTGRAVVKIFMIRAANYLALPEIAVIEVSYQQFQN